MKQLKEILYKVPVEAISGSPIKSISGVEIDSRELKAENIFVAIKGTKLDGHLYIDAAINKGAIAVVCEEFPKHIDKSITYIKVINSSKALGIIAANFYNHPSKKIKLIGVTGTNGKTTITNLLHKLFNKQNLPSGLISTIGINYNKNSYQTKHTTPNIIKINSTLKKMVEAGIEYCFMEVSSHGISQGRTQGLYFAGGVFTNLTHDHLDYHKSFKNYRDIKKRFFDNLPKSSFALVNIDDKNGKFMLQNTVCKKKTFAMKAFADYRVKIKERQFNGMLIEINNNELWTKLIGDFNASNLLAVYSVAINLGMQEMDVLISLSLLNSVPGRFQTFQMNSVIVIIDYAHTPNALENVLDSINRLRNNNNENLITIIGCGGGRDKEKRPKMGRIASQKSDKVIFTSDNPREENPNEIIDQMISGVANEHLHKIFKVEEREIAIKTSKKIASKSDIVLIAGKGHETYQEINNNQLPFDDLKIAKKYFQNQS
ncbi:MAG: UDP-N-acetylmuramoyl-L-alanyl-D-glutamate--2,6-diaminopimelate ligase [Flavobacteriaceae bacterium]|nr:UDP-N-acetylmuramoyl-L-alanyl-D-glutamate--2,6-diaminopimelate ligase [Flavobacteriaceae bacterium]